MTHSDEGFGEARNIFSTNLARIMNVSGLVENSLAHEVKEADAAIEASEQEVREIRERGWVVTGRPLEAVDMPTFFRDHRDRTLGNLGTSCEMAFVYLMAIFDSFFGQWRVETGLDAEDDSDGVPSASPGNIRLALEELQASLDLSSATEQTLKELRARRNVLMHKGGIADQRYCEMTGRWDSLHTRLHVSQGYLYTAIVFINDLVVALAIVGHKEHYVPEVDKVNRERIVSRTLTQKTPPQSRASLG